jgi:hypothetical protein
MKTQNHSIMPKIKHLVGIYCLLLLGIGLSACLEKEPILNDKNKAPFALYKMNLTFIDAESKEAIPNLQVLLRGYSGQAVLSTDAFGKVQVVALASPPTPRVFEISYGDPERKYETNTLHVTFTNPIFKLNANDEHRKDPLYHGFAEISITKELTLYGHE